MSEVSPDVRPARFGGIFGRVAFWIGLGFLLLLVLIVGLHMRERVVSDSASFAVSVIDRTLLMSRLTQTDPALLRRLSDSALRVRLSDSPPAMSDRRDRWGRSTDIRRLVDRHLRSLGIEPQDVMLRFYIERGVPRLTLVLPHQGTAMWLIADARAPRTSAQRHSAGLFGTLFLAAFVFAGVLWGTRRVTRHLPKLVDAAEQIGRGGGETLAVEGPKEIQRASRAFNRMLARIREHEVQRSAMLGAFSHDIRTLVTRLRLRVERITDAQQRAKADADLAAITRIVEEAMAYSQDEVSDEPLVDVELSSLLGALLDDASDAQAAAGKDTQRVGELEGERPVTVRGQAVALRRAFANLIDNALLYGGAVTVSLQRVGEQALVQVSDPGPGIAPEDRERVLAPYVRLETSRNRETGGTGLGLAIVHNVVNRHHGSLEFVRDDAGFHVRVCLPLS